MSDTPSQLTPQITTTDVDDKHSVVQPKDHSHDEATNADEALVHPAFGPVLGTVDDELGGLKATVAGMCNINLSHATYLNHI